MLAVDVHVQWLYSIDFELPSEHELIMTLRSDDAEGDDGGKVRIQFDEPQQTLEKLAAALVMLARG